MINLEKHMGTLGLRVQDKVTGFKGVATCISFDLYGCVQAIVNPGIGKDGKTQDSQWFDISRLKVLDDIPVMDLPNFEFGPVAEGKKGPAEKPLSMKP
jgi:hypothetical protein